jgi:hypothetical protein
MLELCFCYYSAPKLSFWVCQAFLATVEMFYDTSLGTTIRIAHEGSLLEELRLLTLKQDEYSGLCGSDRQSVIPYIHRERCVLLFVWCCSKTVELVQS